MHITVFGAGSIGGLTAAKLAKAGHEVSVVVRGAHLAAIRAQGLILRGPEGEWQGMLPASDNPADLGEQEAVIICTKSHQLEGVATSIAPLLGDKTQVMFIINGLPWWYFYRDDSPFAGRSLQSLDPNGIIANHIDPQRVIGCVSYQAAKLAVPGCVEYVDIHQRELVMGDIGHAITPGAAALYEALQSSGFDVQLTDRIRAAVWDKLWGNSAFNPICTLTGTGMDEVAGEAGDSSLLESAMKESGSVANALGITFPETLQQRIARAGRIQGHTVSMLQDIEAGKPTEIDAIVGAVREVAGWLNIPTPTLELLYKLMRLKERYAPAARRESAA